LPVARAVKIANIVFPNFFLDGYILNDRNTRIAINGGAALNIIIATCAKSRRITVVAHAGVTIFGVNGARVWEASGF
jgi:hypothetical protein